MAPEVTLKQPYNEKADIFSLGCCMFEARCCGANSLRGLFHELQGSLARVWLSSRAAHTVVDLSAVPRWQMACMHASTSLLRETD